MNPGLSVGAASALSAELQPHGPLQLSPSPLRLVPTQFSHYRPLGTVPSLAHFWLETEKLPTPAAKALPRVFRRNLAAASLTAPC